jgi:transcriptional regulator with XRE-family HTH domain
MSADPFETRLHEAFGRVLVRRRIERNMTPEGLAVKADLVDTKAVSMFERGDAPPTLTEFFKIAAALGEQPGFLLVDVVAQWRGDGIDPFHKTRPSDFEKLFRLGYYHKIGDFREQDKAYPSMAEATGMAERLNQQRHERRVALLDTVCIYVRMGYVHFKWEPDSKEARPD